MSIVTLSSDLGINSYLLASWKADILSQNSQNQIIDLYHSSDVTDIEQAAIQLMGAIRSMPDGTIHLYTGMYHSRNFDLVVISLKNQYIVSSDNGLVPLLHVLDYRASILKYTSKLKEWDWKVYFRQYSELLKIIGQWNSQTILEPSNDYIQVKPINMGLSMRPDRIMTRIIAITTLGHIILNITQEEFYQSVQDQKFAISIHTLKIREISQSYWIDNADRVGALFNTAGFLELFMVGDHLASLLSYNKYSNNKIEILLGDDPNRQINF